MKTKVYVYYCNEINSLIICRLDRVAAECGWVCCEGRSYEMIGEL